jgi:PAS domain S-box-containing protein
VVVQKRMNVLTSLEAKLELAEKALAYSNENLELTMRMWIEASYHDVELLAKRAENTAKIATLIQQIRDDTPSDHERELLDAASPRSSLLADYGELLEQITDGQSYADAGVLTANVMLPLLLDNSSWKAFVEFLRAQLKMTEAKDGETGSLAERTRELVRQNQVFKSIVAERKRLEERLSQLASLIEYANDAIAIYTLGGTIVSWNKGAEALYGYSASEVLGRSRYVLIVPDEPDQIPEFLERLKREEIVPACEAVHIRKNGQRIHVSMSLSPVKDINAQVVGFAAITRQVPSSKPASRLRSNTRPQPSRN